jgi:thymidylate synthase (FAD)
MKAELINVMGDDITVVNAARVSFDKESEWEAFDVETSPCGSFKLEHGIKLSERDTKLIHYLARHGHFTPFTHTAITLRETVPIFVARQRFKHVVGFTYNEVSRRYVDSEPKFYMPDTWRKRADDKKQGSSEEVFTGSIVWYDYDGKYEESVTTVYEHVVNACECAYRKLIDAGICPEQARMVLPQSMMTSYYVTGSLAAFARAYNLRSKPDAQKEIQMLAAQWDEIIRPLFPVSWEALTQKESS